MIRLWMAAPAELRSQVGIGFSSMLLSALVFIFAFSGSVLPQAKEYQPNILVSEDGVRYVSSGVGYDSRINLPRFSLRLIFSTRTQKYLASIDVEITPGPSGKPTRIHSRGPWLEVDLAPGNYKVRCRTAKGHVATQTFKIIKGRVTPVKVVWNISDEEI